MDVPGVDWGLGGGGLGDDLALTPTRSRPAHRAACRALPFGNVVAAAGLGCLGKRLSADCRPAHRAACRALPFGNLVAAAGLGCLGKRLSADCTIYADRVMPALPAILSINSTCLARAVMLIRTVRCASGLT